MSRISNSEKTTKLFMQLIIIFLAFLSNEFIGSNDLLQTDISFNILDYYPIHIGDEWQYKQFRYDFFNAETLSISYTNEKIIGDTILNNTKYYIKKNSTERFERIDTTFQRVLYYYPPDSEGIFMDFNSLHWECDTATVNDFGLILPQITTGNSTNVTVFVKGIGLTYQTFAKWGIHDFKYLVYAKINNLIYCTAPNTIESHESAPDNCELEQNYPNPFNSSTLIAYSLPQPEHVNLTIYNYSGKKIKIVINKWMPAGKYFFQWDGTNEQNNRVTTGVYIYKLCTNKVITKKMLLIQ